MKIPCSKDALTRSEGLDLGYGGGGKIFLVQHIFILCKFVTRFSLVED